MTSNGVKTLMSTPFSIRNGPKWSLFPLHTSPDHLVSSIFNQATKPHHHYATSPKLFEQNRAEIKSAIDDDRAQDLQQCL